MSAPVVLPPDVVFLAPAPPARAVHVLKVAPDYMGDLLSGRKRFEVRKNDRGFQAGDVLVLAEWDGREIGLHPGMHDAACRLGDTSAHRARAGGHCPWSGRSLTVRVAYVYAGGPRQAGALGYGWVVLGLSDPIGGAE